MNGESRPAGKSVRIGCASGFWGDTNTAAAQLVEKGKLDFLVFDYLAEITMSILAAQKMKDPEAGFAHDFVKTVMGPLLPELQAQGIRVISNAGGVNPEACARALGKLADAQGMELKIAVVHGDDLMPEKSTLNKAGIKEMFTGQPLPGMVVSMNAYLGAPAIAAALDAGADIVITGRVVDSAIVSGPLMHAFGWSWQDYDRLAQASLAGHIIECGAQCTGGNFTDWQLVAADYPNMGFPIVDVYQDGSFDLSTPPDTGGLVSFATVAEQLVYEIDDPQNYRLPDVICDFSDVNIQTLTQQDQACGHSGSARVSGARGKPPGPDYKVSATWPDGFKCAVSFLIAGINATAKGQAVADAILKKTSRLFIERELGDYTETSVELLGIESTYGMNARPEFERSREVVVKIGCAHQQKQALVLFSREIAQASTGMAPGMTGLVGGRPDVWPKIRLFSCMVPKTTCKLSVGLLESGTFKFSKVELPSTTAQPDTSSAETSIVESAAGSASTDSGVASSHNSADANGSTVPLIKLAWARSGDKGDRSNIGVIARRPEWLPAIRSALTAEAVAAFMAHTLSGSQEEQSGLVTRFDLPGIHGLNFLLNQALGGGGVASLRIDPQGKAFAQQLLDFPIPVSESLLEELNLSGANEGYRSVFRDRLFSGQTHIVTGGGSGIGRCTAHELAALGARVVLIGRKQEKLDATSAEISEDGGAVATRVCDIRDEEAVIATVRSIVDEYDQIHGLVNNAGGQFPGPLSSISQKGFETVVRTNLTGGFLMAREVYKQSMSKHGGAIVNIIADMWGGMPGMGHSGAARAGMENFTKTAAVEWASSGVRINAVAPGWIASSGLDNYDASMKPLIDQLAESVPQKRLGSEAEISAAICFLLGEGACFVNGATLRVDGAASLGNRVWPLAKARRKPEYNGFHRSVLPKVLRQD